MLTDSTIEEGICPTCSGSGEGLCEGTTCYHCGGSGVIHYYASSGQELDEDYQPNSEDNQDDNPI